MSEKCLNCHRRGPCLTFTASLPSGCEQSVTVCAECVDDPIVSRTIVAVLVETLKEHHEHELRKGATR